MPDDSPPSSMRAWQADPAASGAKLRSTRLPRPEPGPGEVLVRLGAASLNYRDLLVARGFYGTGQKPVIPLSDGAGRIVAVGAGVSRARIGARVAGAFFPDWIDGPVSAAKRARSLGAQLDGMLAEYACLPEAAAIEVPAHLSDIEAATLPCAGLTGWHAVTGVIGLRPGMTILLQGAGGVSVMALQFARLMGLQVIHTTGTGENAERLRALGAHEVIIGRDWSEAVKVATGGLGVDAVVDIGGPGSLAQSVQAVKVGGTIVSVGFAGEGPGIEARNIVGRAIRLSGITVGSCAMFHEMNRAIAHAGLRPVIDAVFPFSEAAEAFARLEAGGHIGKLVIEIAET